MAEPGMAEPGMASLAWNEDRKGWKEGQGSQTHWVPPNQKEVLGQTGPSWIPAGKPHLARVVCAPASAAALPSQPWALSCLCSGPALTRWSWELGSGWCGNGPIAGNAKWEGKAPEKPHLGLSPGTSAQALAFGPAWAVLFRMKFPIPSSPTPHFKASTLNQHFHWCVWSSWKMSSLLLNLMLAGKEDGNLALSYLWMSQKWDYLLLCGVDGFSPSRPLGYSQTWQTLSFQITGMNLPVQAKGQTWLLTTVAKIICLPWRNKSPGLCTKRDIHADELMKCSGELVHWPTPCSASSTSPIPNQRFNPEVYLAPREFIHTYLQIQSSFYTKN